MKIGTISLNIDNIDYIDEQIEDTAPKGFLIKFQLGEPILLSWDCDGTPVSHLKEAQVRELIQPLINKINKKEER